MNRSPAALLVLMALCGCGATPAGAPVTLRFWAMGREGEVVAELAREFERANPGIRVDVQQVPWSAAHEKFLTAYVGHAVPDISQLGNTWVPEFSALNALEPLDKWVGASASLRQDSYFPGIWDTNVIDGQCYGVPWYVDTRVLFYRRDILAAAGYDSIPQTWSGWRAAMEAVKRQIGPDRYPMFFPVNEWTQPAIFGLQAGSPLLADQATRGAFQEPAFRRAFDFYLGVYRDRLAPSVGNNEIANVYQEFARGYICMWITGPWNLGEMSRRLPPELQDKWATAPLPGPDGPAGGLSLAGGSSLVVWRESRHKEAAWRLLEFLGEPAQQLRFYELTGDLPARMESWQDPRLRDNPRINAFGVQLQRVAATPKVPEWELIATRLLEKSEMAIRGKASPDTVLALLDREVERILDKRRWLLSRVERRPAGSPP